MKSALITGITGQTGSYLAEILLEKGYEVHGLIRRSSTHNTQNIDGIKDKLQLHYGDLTDMSGLSNLIWELKPDEIYNMGAMSHVGISFKNPVYTQIVDGDAVNCILETIRLCKKDIKLYQASTCLVCNTKVLVQKMIKRIKHNKEQEFLTLGAENIEDIKVGDHVLSYNEKNGKKEYKTVSKVSNRITYNIYKVSFSNGNYLEMSNNHPVYVINKGWVTADKLTIGDEVIQKRYNGIAGIVNTGKTNKDIYGEKKAQEIKEKASIAHSGFPNNMKGLKYPKWHRITGKHPERAAKHVWNKGLRSESNDKLRNIGCKISQKQKLLWSDTKYKDRLLRSIFEKRTNAKMNKWECEVNNILNKTFPNEFIYSGDGKNIIINGIIPDFININGKNKVIEVYSDFWKNRNYGSVDNYINVRSVKLNKLGYDVLFINKNDLNDIESLNLKIKKFIYNPSVDIVKISDIQIYSTPTVVYNIEVDDNHNFFAKGILVHNSELFGNSAPPQNENSPMLPNSPYSLAKYHAYLAVKNYREVYGIFACQGILFNHTSPRRGEDFVSRKITLGIANILAEKQKVLKLGNLDAKRDWGYAPEYAEAIYKIMQLPNPEDVVIGSGESHTIREFLHESFRCVGLDWEDYVMIDEKLIRPTEVNYLLADTAKAQSLIGWNPQVKFKDLVRIMVKHDIELVS